MVWRTAAFAAAYALAIVIGRLTVLPETGLPLFWPAAGVAVTWVLLSSSRRERVAMGVLVFLLATTGNALTGIAGDASLVIGVANVVTGLATWSVYVRLNDRYGSPPTDIRAVGAPPLRRLGDLLRFLVAVATAVTVSAVFGMLGLAVAETSVGAQTALGWVLRNGAAVVVIAGTALALRDARAVVTRRHLVEGLGILAVVLVVLWFVFGQSHTISLSFLPLAVLVWGGLRLPVPLAALLGAVTAVVALALGLSTTAGPFGSAGDVVGQALTLQAFMMLATILSLVLSTTQWERDRLVLDVATTGRTARRQAEDLRVITETIPDALIVMDRDGSVVLHNEAARRWLAVAEDGATGRLDTYVRPLRQRADGSLLDSRDRPFLRALAGETVRGLVVEADDLHTGLTRLVSVDAAPLLDAASNVPDRALLVLRDVTEEHRRLDDIEAARTRTERLIADAPHGVAVLDVRGKVLQANESLATITGRALEDLVSASFGDLAPDHREEVSRHLLSAVNAPGSRVAGEWTLPRAGRDPVHVSLTSRAISSEDGDEDVILVNVVDLSERRRYEQRLAHLADHDPLTGLPNRRRFDEALEDHLERCTRDGPTGALLLLDLDHFKEVNDTDGHDAGDDLIVSVADLLRGSLRETDLVARLGGDEFAFILPDVDRSGAGQVADSIVERVRDHSRNQKGVNRRVTASVGVVTFAAAAGRPEDILALADMLMYDAKDAGRDRFAVLDDSAGVQPRTFDRMEWKSRIEAALDNDLFELYLQPVLHLDSGRISGAEALIRLVDRDEPVAPGRFIAVAERAGLAPAIDAWVVRHATDMLVRLLRVDPEMRLGINLSAHSIADPSIALMLEELLRKRDVDASRLVVEVTETAAVSDVRAARRFAEPLRALGVEFALDDFGSGYGSFYYLKHLSFDTIKIDGEFVKGAHESAVDRAILRSVVGIARSLGKRTVAEFVTDEAALNLVRELGVDFAQGFLIGEPLPFDRFVATHLTADRGVWPGLPTAEDDGRFRHALTHG